MPPFQLFTRKDVRLVDRSGNVVLSAHRDDDEEPLLLLVLLAIAGASGLSTNELLLLLTPELTRDKGKAELERLASALDVRLGGDRVIMTTPSGLALRSALVELDVRVLDDDAPHPDKDFLASFKMSNAPELADWIDRTRKRVAATDPATPGGFWRRGSTQYMAIALAAAAITAAGVYATTPGPVQGFAAGDPLLVADIKNETGDSLLGLGVATATTVSLQQSSHLRLHPRTRVRLIYQLMKLPNADTALTFPLAREVAQRDQVRFVLGLAIARTGDRYRVTANLADVTKDDVVYTTTADARSRADVLTAIDRVLTDTRRRLGESRRDVAGHQTPLPLVTTSSLEALRSYAEGSAAWSKQRYGEAREAWSRAVDLDTGFAMAYGALGMWSYYHHDRGEGERFMREAFGRANRLTEWERLRLLFEEASFSGMRDSALALGRMIAERFPNATTWYNYGTGLMRAGYDSAARQALERSLAFDSTRATPYVNLASVARSQRKYDEALAYYARAAQRDSLILYSGSINLEWGGALVYLGRYAEAESAFTKMSRAPALFDRSVGFRALGSLAMWQGHVDRAIAAFQQATDASVQDRSQLSELRNRMFLASAYRSVGRLREANDEMTRALQLARDRRTEPRVLAMAAANCIKLGRVADAAELLSILRSRVGTRDRSDSAAYAYVAGLLAYARHRPDSALIFLRGARALPDEVQLNALAAEAYHATGQLDSARAAVGRIVDMRTFGLEAQEDMRRAPLVLGDVLLAMRDTAGAIKNYQRLVDERRGAQREVADVAAARARLAMLSGQVSR